MFNYLSSRITNDKGEADPTAGQTLVTGGRLNTLPEVLAGPILRDTTPNRISIWIATRSAQNLTLKIYSPTGQEVASSDPTGLKKLGKYLYVGVVTATTANALQPGLVYTYNVFFSNTAAQTTNNLTTPGILNAPGSAASGIDAITYASSGLALPSFALVPPQLEDVRILHSSCRKPHGPGDDAFGGEGSKLLEAVINNALPTATELARPHLLFLTGDQIYSDDVAPQLLFMLDDASKALLDSVETLLFPSGIQNTPVTEAVDRPLPLMISPDQRQELIYSGKKIKKTEPAPTIGPTATTSGLTSQEAHNHLMRLGEFYAMYLFAWSDVLWGDYSSAQEAWQLVMRRAWPVPPSAIDLTTATDGAKAAYRIAVTAYKEDKKKAAHFEEQYASLLAFREHVKGARRLLANIPTYMIWDDHEVTDDWYLNLRWCQQVLGDEQMLLNSTASGYDGRIPIMANPLGSRIVANGTAAYIAFQDWGNRPLLYATTGAHKEALDLLVVTQNPVDSALLAQKVLPKLRIITPSTGVKDGLQDVKALVNELRFDYVLNQGPLQVLFLDSRTKRGFNPSVDTLDPQLISAHIIDDVFSQLPPGAPSKTTLVVAPGPIFGHNAVDLGQELGTRKYVDKNRDEMSDKAVDLDREAWIFNEKLFLKVIQRLSHYSSVIVLSGDVHYAFSNYVRAWNEENVTDHTTRSGEVRGAIVQLVASASKNESPLTVLSRRLSPFPTRMHPHGIWAAAATYKYVTAGSPTSTTAISSYTKKAAAHEVISLAVPHRVLRNYPPTLRYETQLVRDTRSPQEKGYSQVTVGSASAQLEAAAHHQFVAKLGFGHTVTVGFNNVGSVRFQGGNVVHELHHRRYGLLGIGASGNTRHVIPLAAPGINDPRPGDPPLN